MNTEKMIAVMYESLSQHPDIINCIILPRRDAVYDDYIHVYFTSKSLLSEDELQKWMQKNAPVKPALIRFTQISALPTGSEKTRRRTLTRLPDIDPSVLQHWRTVYKHLAGSPVDIVAEDYRSRENEIILLSEVDSADNVSDGERSEVIGNREACISPSDNEALPDESVSTLITAAVQKFPQAESTFLLSERDIITLSGSEIYQAALKVTQMLHEHVPERGTVIILAIRQPDDYLICLWACFLGGYIPAPLPAPAAADITAQDALKLVSAWQSLHQPFILTTENEKKTLTDIWQQKGLRETFLLKEDGNSCVEACPSPPSGEETALLLFTSGSTGDPKVVMLSHAAILAEVRGCGHRFLTNHNDVFFHWMSMEHGASICMMHLHALHHGAAQVISPTYLVLKDPLRWLAWMDQYRATISWAPNFAFALVTDCLEGSNARTYDWDLSCIRILYNGGEAIVPRVARKFITTLAEWKLPSDAVQAAWGMAETASGCIFSPIRLENTSDNDLFCSLGSPLSGMGIRIVDNNDLTVKEGITGELQIAGPMVTRGYYNNEKANKESFTTDGWFRTGDLGFIRNGELTISGRKKDTIIVNGNNFYCHELEALIEELPFIKPSFTAACPVRLPDDSSDRLAVFCVLHTEIDEVTARKAIITRLSAMGGITPHWVIFTAPESIPKTELGKIQRSRLVREHMDQLSGAPEQESLPGWFYTDCWCGQALRERVSDGSEQEVLIVVLRGTTLVPALPDHLQNDGMKVSVVYDNPRVQPDISREHHIVLDCSDEAQFAEFFSQRVASGRTPSCIIYSACELAGSVTEDAPAVLEQVVSSCLVLSNILRLTARLWKIPKRRLIALTCDAEQVGAEKSNRPGYGGLHAMLLSANEEQPELTFSCIDVSHKDNLADSNILRAEILQADGESRIAWRAGKRYVFRLSPLFTHRSHVRYAQFQYGGAYAITGGLGGVGSELAYCLITEFRARVVLLGRRSLSEIEQDPQCNKRLKQLKGLSSDFFYRTADVTDASQLHRALDETEQAWQSPLDAVFHLAGIGESGKADELTQSSIVRSADAKLTGSCNLFSWHRKQKSTRLVFFSSALSVCGSEQWGSYSAANAVMNALVRKYSQAGYPCQSLLWGLWEGTGMSRGLELRQSTALKGLPPLPPQIALTSLQIAMSKPDSVITIGISSSGSTTRHLMCGPVRLIRQCVAYIDDREQFQKLESLTARLLVADRYGNPTPCFIVQGRAAHREDKPVSDNISFIISKIWSDVLKRKDINSDEDFYVLGGSSIQWVVILAALEKQFDITLRWEEIAQCRTIASQTQLVTSLKTDAYNSGL